MLKNNFSKSGVTLDEFKKVNEALADITFNVEVLGKDLTFLSLCTIPSHQVPGKAVFYVFSEETLADFFEGKKLQIGAIDRSTIGEELLKELEETTGLMIVHRPTNTKYLVSDLAIPTMTIRSKVNGESTINRQNIVRNMHFADSIISMNERINFIYREENGIKKIFAGMGTQFKPVRQTIIADMADKISEDKVMGNAVVKFWGVDHAFTELNLAFPKLSEDFEAAYGVAGVIPGVQLMTSDIGRCSIIARGCYFRKGSNSYVVTDEIQNKHVSSVTAEEVLKNVDEGIFDKIRLFPELLATLIGKDVTDYSKIDLTSEEGQLKNRSAVSELYKKCVRQVFKSDLPVKRQKELIEALNDEINPSVPYTLYDIAMTFMDIPERIKGVDYVTLMNIRKCCAKAPQVISKQAKAVEEEESAYLSA